MKRTRGKKGRIMGRIMDQKALSEVRELLNEDPRKREMLIEYLHRIQDRYHYISNRHILALAMEMNIPMTEVYETATFYHHFDVIKEISDATRKGNAGCSGLAHGVRAARGGVWFGLVLRSCR